MQLPHQTRRLPNQLRTVRVFLRALPEPQQGDQNILFRVLIRQKRLPAAVSHVVPSHELDLRGQDLVLDFVDADFPRADVAAGGAKVFHAGQRQFAEVAVFDAGGYEGHRDIALHTVDPRPRRDERQDPRDEVDERVGGVVLVASCAPELVESSPADHEGGVDFEAVGAEGGVGEVLLELEEVALKADVGQVGHHVRDDFEAGVLGHGEGLADGADGVPAVSVAGDVFVEGLHADFEAGAAVAEHVC